MDERDSALIDWMERNNVTARQREMLVQEG
jgi:hypothetical protein